MITKPGPGSVQYETILLKALSDAVKSGLKERLMKVVEQEVDACVAAAMEQLKPRIAAYHDIGMERLVINLITNKETGDGTRHQ